MTSDSGSLGSETVKGLSIIFSRLDGLDEKSKASLNTDNSDELNATELANILSIAYRIGLKRELVQSFEEEFISRVSEDTVLDTLGILLGSHASQHSINAVYPPAIAHAIGFAMQRFSLLLAADWAQLAFPVIARCMTFLGRVDSTFPSVLLASVVDTLAPAQSEILSSLCPEVGLSVAVHLLQGHPSGRIRALSRKAIAQGMHAVPRAELCEALADLPVADAIAILSHTECSITPEDAVLDLTVQWAEATGATPAQVRQHVRATVRLPHLSQAALARMAEERLVDTADLIAAAKSQALATQPSPPGLVWGPRSPVLGAVGVLSMAATIIYPPVNTGPSTANRMTGHLVAAGLPMVTCISADSTDPDLLQQMLDSDIVFIATPVVNDGVSEAVEAVTASKAIAVYTADAVPAGCGLVTTPATLRQVTDGLGDGPSMSTVMVTTPTPGRVLLPYRSGAGCVTAGAGPCLWNTVWPAGGFPAEFDLVRRVLGVLRAEFTRRLADW